jgi:hypothetical protein
MAGRARVLGGFAAFGVFWGAWGATLPAVQSHAGVDDGQLGIALLCVGAGALASMRPAGTVVDRWGAPALPAALAAFAAAAALPGLATSMAGLCAALLVLGATSGAVDVAINAEGVRSEAATGQPVMSLAHGTFSACVVGGSLAAGGLRAAGAGPELVLALVGGVVAAMAAALLRAPAAAGARATARASLRHLPRLLVILGGLCALAFFVENAWQSWGAVHLESDLDASPAVGALAPALFAGAAALSRLGGHGLAGRVNEVTLLRAGAALGAAGTLLGALAPGAALALVGVGQLGQHALRRRPHPVGLRRGRALPLLYHRSLAHVGAHADLAAEDHGRSPRGREAHVRRRRLRRAPDQGRGRLAAPGRAPRQARRQRPHLQGHKGGRWPPAGLQHHGQQRRRRGRRAVRHLRGGEDPAVAVVISDVLNC